MFIKKCKAIWNVLTGKIAPEVLMDQRELIAMTAAHEVVTALSTDVDKLAKALEYMKEKQVGLIEKGYATLAEKGPRDGRSKKEVQK